MSSFPKIASENTIETRPETNLPGQLPAEPIIPLAMIDFFKRFQKYQEQAASLSLEGAKQG